MSESRSLFNITKDEKSKTSRLQIMDGFIEVLSKFPHEKPSVKSIVSTVGVTRSTFYTYFDSVDDLYQSIIAEFVHHAEKYLLCVGENSLLVDMLTKWFDFCHKNCRFYVALSDAGDHVFTESMIKVWQRHLTVMMDYDCVPNDMFRAMHFAYIPQSNEYMVYAWLTKPELKDMPAKILAQIINNQRINYVSRTSVYRQAPRRPFFSRQSQFICSEVVSIMRVRELLQTGKEKLIHEYFTDEEILQAEKSALSLYFYAQFYAAKRAITSRICGHIDEKLFKNISIVVYDNDAERVASASLSGKAAVLAEEKNINTINLFTAYETDYAVAFVVMTM